VGSNGDEEPKISGAYPSARLGLSRVLDQGD